MNAVVTAARRAAGAATLLVAIGALAVTVAMRLDAIRVSRVLTGSMGDHAPAGSLVVSRPAEAADLERGQVVVFVPPAPFGTPDGRPVVHRVVDVTREGGEVLIRTKGDANAAADPWTLNASRSTVFRLRWASPLAGDVAALGGRLGASVVVATIVLCTALRALLAIWRPRPSARARRAAERRPAVSWLRDAAA